MQAVRYAKDYAKVTGHLVVFNLSDIAWGCRAMAPPNSNLPGSLWMA